jgi:hypothetical protein
MGKAKESAPVVVGPHLPPRRIDQIAQGPNRSPEMQIKLFDDKEWERFVRDWAETLPRDVYHTVDATGGAGDEGRDVIAYCEPPAPKAIWDNFQCKFYPHPLRPTDIWPEIGKLCYYTFIGRYTIPRQYLLAAPKDIGTSVRSLIRDPKRFKQQLIEVWPKLICHKIRSKATPLEGDLAKHVDGFELSIVDYVPTRRMVERMRGSQKYFDYFSGRLPDRPTPQPPPGTVDARRESRYLTQLLNAYADCLKCAIADAEAIPTAGVHRQHFRRSREHFYSAESLRVFARTSVGEATFDALSEEIRDGVFDTSVGDYADGFERVKETLKAARALQVTANALLPVLSSSDRAGICHQLANLDELIWVDGK